MALVSVIRMVLAQAHQFLVVAQIFIKALATIHQKAANLLHNDASNRVSIIIHTAEEI